MPGVSYFINPVTGRIIKSTGKTYKELKRKRYILEGDACLYNMTSVKRCLKTINRLYPNVYYPSTFIDIPSTYHKKSNYEAVAFIKNNEAVNGYVTKNGLLVKLENPIPISENKTLPLVVGETINEKLEREGMEATSEQNDLLKTQLEDNPLKSDIKILYNPMQDDYIPVKGDITNEEQENLLNTINNTLIKNTDDTSSDIGSDIGSDISGDISSDVESEVESDISSDVKSEVESDISSDVESDISSDVKSEVESDISSDVESYISSDVKSEVESDISSDVKSEVEIPSEIVRDEIDNQLIEESSSIGSDFSDDANYYEDNYERADEDNSERADEDNSERADEDNSEGILSQLPDISDTNDDVSNVSDTDTNDDVSDTETNDTSSQNASEEPELNNEEQNKEEPNTDNKQDDDKLNYIVLNSHEDIIGWLSKL